MWPDYRVLGRPTLLHCWLVGQPSFVRALPLTLENARLVWILFWYGAKAITEFYFALAQYVHVPGPRCYILLVFMLRTFFHLWITYLDAIGVG